MYKNGYAKSLQYIFEREPTKPTKKSYPAVASCGTIFKTDKIYLCPSSKPLDELIQTIWIN